MKGLKVIPWFAILMVLSYLGVIFVRQNPDDVVVHFGQRSTPAAALGFVILTSWLAGMLFAGALCSVELLALYVQNQKMKRRLYPNRQAPSGLLPWKKLEAEINESVDDPAENGSEPKTERTGTHGD